MENRFSAYYMPTPKNCISCPFSTKSGNTLGCCISINARANASMAGLENYKSCYCPLITGIDDTDFIQNELERRDRENKWWEAHAEGL